MVDCIKSSQKIVCLFSFLTSSSTTRLSRGRVPRLMEGRARSRISFRRVEGTGFSSQVLRVQFFRTDFTSSKPGNSTNIILQKVGFGHFHLTHQNFL